MLVCWARKNIILISTSEEYDDGNLREETGFKPRDYQGKNFRALSVNRVAQSHRAMRIPPEAHLL